jgi:hypothetical protein
LGTGLGELDICLPWLPTRGCRRGRAHQVSWHAHPMRCNSI